MQADLDNAGKQAQTNVFCIVGIVGGGPDNPDKRLIWLARMRDDARFTICGESTFTRFFAGLELGFAFWQRAECCCNSIDRCLLIKISDHGDLDRPIGQTITDVFAQPIE